MTKTHVMELVKWQALPKISNQAMVAAVDGLLPDLQMLPGFINQTLYRDKDGIWVSLYFWETEKNGVASNELMAPKASFIKLLALIEPTSIEIEFFSPASQ